MTLGLIVLVGSIICFVIYALMAERDSKKHHEVLYKQDPEANLARLKEQIANDLELARQFDAEDVIQILSRERSKGVGWDVALKTALPKIANVQLLQLRNNIVNLAQGRNSEREVIETVVRSFVRPSTSQPEFGPPSVASPDVVPTHSQPEVPDLASLSPREIGRGIAISLDVSCRIEKVSEKERELLREANVPIERYHQEVLVLAGFAQDYAIYTLIGDSEIGKQVLAGYREAWQNVAKGSPAGAALFELFVKRCPEYAKAALGIEEAAKDGVTVWSPVALIFGGHIQPENRTPEQRGTAQILAMQYADIRFSSHFESTMEALRIAKLLK